MDKPAPIVIRERDLAAYTREQWYALYELQRRKLVVIEKETEQPLWRPFPHSPQESAYNCIADELLFGGAAGSGKSWMLLGLAVTVHQRSVIFRREAVQLQALIEDSRAIIGTKGRFNQNSKAWRLPGGQILTFAGVENEDDWQKYAGQPRDLLCFDELAGFTQVQYEALSAWNRTSTPGQRCRIVGATNPPLPGQPGTWILSFWAPWLDPQFPDPAEPGELRWYAKLDDELVWTRDGERLTAAPFEHHGEVITPKSRTFIPGRVQDNPVLMQQGYLRTLQALPEPMRSALLFGDFGATAEDNPWQVIPTRWVQLAMERWIKAGGPRYRPPDFLTAVGVDPARGGRDSTVIAKRYGPWFAPLYKYKGSETPDGPAVVAKILLAMENDPPAPINVDPIGVGAAPLDLLRQQLHAPETPALWPEEAKPLEFGRLQASVNPVNFAARAVDLFGKPLCDKSGKFRFANLRAAAYWALREALDPESGQDLMLPDDRELLGDLCAPRFEISAQGILVEKKAKIKEKLGRSPGAADSVVYAFFSVPPPVVHKLRFN